MPHDQVVAGAQLVECDPKPLAIDLFCGLGGWAEGFLEEGYRVVGFDIERRPYPGSLVLQDVLTIHGSQFRDAACLVASPPCQAYSYMAMPWTRGKAMAAEIRADESGERLRRLNALFHACFRIQREASEAAGRYIPLVVENVKGAQPWVGSARWHYGSFYLWGDVPALMPITFAQRMLSHAFHQPGVKNVGGSWFAISHNNGERHNPVHDQKLDGLKRPGRTLPEGFNNWPKDGDGYYIVPASEGTKQRFSSRSDARKAASAQIAKIPFPLAQHIARVYKPDTITRGTDRQQEACL